MTVRIKKLDHTGHSTMNLTLNEAQAAVEADEGKYFIIDEDTTEILQNVPVKDGQKLMFVPVVQGG
jgi:hypothetical protein